MRLPGKGGGIREARVGASMVRCAPEKILLSIAPSSLGSASMDADRFDSLTRSISTTTRRGAVGLLIGSALGGLLPLGTRPTEAKKGGNDRHRGGDANTEACIPTGKRCPSRKPRGRNGKGKNGKRAKQLSCQQCCQRRVTSGPDGKLHCTCQPTHQPCRETRECCDGACIGGTCQAAAAASPPPPPPPTPPPPTPPLPSPTCLALGQSCSPTSLPCCTDVAEAAECAGGLNPETTCQDCDQALTQAGVFCKDPPGNQCCGGFSHCAVGIKVQDGTLVCYQPVLGGFCRRMTPCTSDSDCPEQLAVCIRVEPGSPCCPPIPPMFPQATTACGLRCPL